MPKLFIDGREYNTETAELITTHSAAYDNDTILCWDELYRCGDGAYFLYREISLTAEDYDVNFGCENILQLIIPFNGVKHIARLPDGWFKYVLDLERQSSPTIPEILCN